MVLVSQHWFQSVDDPKATNLFGQKKWITLRKGHKLNPAFALSGEEITQLTAKMHAELRH